MSYTPLVSDGTGDYIWVASYPGDGPNTNAAATTGCNDPLETITLIGTSSMTSEQDWLPNDHVTLTSNGGALDGALTVTLYQGSFTVTDGVCTPDDPAHRGAHPAVHLRYDRRRQWHHVRHDEHGLPGRRDNDGDYFWLVHYDDANFTDPATTASRRTSPSPTDPPGHGIEKAPAPGPFFFRRWMNQWPLPVDVEARRCVLGPGPAGVVRERTSASDRPALPRPR